jgi:hypothetical protein
MSVLQRRIGQPSGQELFKSAHGIKKRIARKRFVPAIGCADPAGTSEFFLVKEPWLASFSG